MFVTLFVGSLTNVMVFLLIHCQHQSCVCMKSPCFPQILNYLVQLMNVSCPKYINVYYFLSWGILLTLLLSFFFISNFFSIINLKLEKGFGGMQVLVTAGLIYKNERVDCSSANSIKEWQKATKLSDMWLKKSNLDQTIPWYLLLLSILIKVKILVLSCGCCGEKMRVNSIEFNYFRKSVTRLSL